MEDWRDKRCGECQWIKGCKNAKRNDHAGDCFESKEDVMEKIDGLSSDVLDEFTERSYEPEVAEEVKGQIESQLNQAHKEVERLFPAYSLLRVRKVLDAIEVAGRELIKIDWK